MKNLLKDPLLHFLLVGALLFLVFEIFKDPTATQDREIYISSADIKALSANFRRTWQRPPTEVELAKLVEEMARDEMAYREAVAMGLDKNDPIVRPSLAGRLTSRIIRS
jgi:hypothetical protein